MDDDEIEVTAAEFEAAALVWLRTMADGVWRKNEEEERKRAEKRWTAGEFPDPKAELARYLRGKLEQSGWTVVRKKPTGLFDAARPSSR